MDSFLAFLRGRRMNSRAGSVWRGRAQWRRGGPDHGRLRREFDGAALIACTVIGISPCQVDTWSCRPTARESIRPRNSCGLLRALAGPAISAELRSHGVSETPAIVPQNVELCLAVAGNDAGLVIRTAPDNAKRPGPSTGAIWLSPVGVGDNVIAIKRLFRRPLHLYLPRAYSAGWLMTSISRERHPTPSVTSPACGTRSSIKSVSR